MPFLGFSPAWFLMLSQQVSKLATCIAGAKPFSSRLDR